MNSTVKVKIGAVEYAICWKHRPRFEGRFVPATIDFFTPQIDLYIGLAPPIEFVNLWHETLHGILRNAGYTEHDEDLINALAHGIVQVLVENPRVLHAPFTPQERSLPEDKEPETSLDEEYAVQRKEEK